MGISSATLDSSRPPVGKTGDGFTDQARYILRLFKVKKEGHAQEEVEETHGNHNWFSGLKLGFGSRVGPVGGRSRTCGLDEGGLVLPVPPVLSPPLGRRGRRHRVVVVRLLQVELEGLVGRGVGGAIDEVLAEGGRSYITATTKKIGNRPTSMDHDGSAYRATRDTSDTTEEVLERSEPVEDVCPMLGFKIGVLAMAKKVEAEVVVVH